MSKPFYLEIGTEELPASYIRPALNAMAKELVRFLDEHRIAHDEPCTTGTPRRLCVAIPSMAEHQEPSITEIVGPPKQVAFDSDGQPTKAAIGFARSQGVEVEQLQIKTTPKGEYVYVVREEKGLPARELLARMLPDFIARIPFPKSMRWGALSVTFARPIHWIVALLGEDTIPFQYGDVASGNRSAGHRFMSPGWFQANADFKRHKDELRRRYVIVDYEERRNIIEKMVGEEAAKVGAQVLTDEDLLDEVTQLVEYPYAVLGRFDEKYLELPAEVSITVMKEHQRCFALIDNRGKLLPYFVAIANTVPRNPEMVAAGNNRVVRARLEDAQFYFKDDLKVSLEKRAEELKNVVFHSRLGTSWEKVERIIELSRWLAESLCPERLEETLRAALLCKADLVTGMVGEFPELQGVMGREYARRQGEPETVAMAIYEHYLPTHSGGPLPEGIEGTILSISDKIDTIVGCFGVGLIPTGTTDPFALRRQTLGIIRIILEKKLAISLEELIDRALTLLKSRITEPEGAVRSGVLDFFHGRLLHYLADKNNYDLDIVEAALAPGIDNMVHAEARARALAMFRNRPDFDQLVTAFKRVANIIKHPEDIPIDTDILEEGAERMLFNRLQEVKEIVFRCLKEANFTGALEAVAKLEEPIDEFFDNVLVMDKNESIRRNRLAMLTELERLFSLIADFRKLRTG